MQIACKDHWEKNLHNDKFTKLIEWTQKLVVQIICMCICIALMVTTFVLRIVADGGFIIGDIGF